MRRTALKKQNEEAKKFLEENGLADVVLQTWKSEQVQNQVSKAYVKFDKYAKELIKSTPKELEVKGLTFIAEISEDTFKQDALMMYECIIQSVKIDLDKAEKELSEAMMLEDTIQAVQESSEMLLLEMLQKIYEIPSYFEVAVSNFAAKELL